MDSKLIYSTEVKKTLRVLMERCEGDATLAIKILTKPPCSYESVRQMADAFAELMGITPAEFVKIWRKIRSE
jgi:hypothetical protein